jgi:hypothetical protein
MIYFQTQTPNLGKFWRALEWKTLVFIMVMWIILRPFDISHVNLEVILVYFSMFGILCQEKCGNPGRH